MEDVKYYECHVTIEPVFDKELALLKAIAEEYNFQVADLLMQRRAQDTPTRSAKDTFCTTRSKVYDDIVVRMDAFVVDCEIWGFKVWRKKIEAVVYDERTRT